MVQPRESRHAHRPPAPPLLRDARRVGVHIVEDEAAGAGLLALVELNSIDPEAPRYGYEHRDDDELLTQVPDHREDEHDSEDDDDQSDGYASSEEVEIEPAGQLSRQRGRRIQRHFHASNDNPVASPRCAPSVLARPDLLTGPSSEEQHVMTTPAGSQTPADAPALIGIGVADQRLDAPGGLEALALMEEAARRAFADCGHAALASEIDWVGAPVGTWSYRDPGREVARRLGADDVRSVRAEVGILQQDLIGRACDVVSTGAAEVALVVGGEARRRDQLARRAGATSGRGVGEAKQTTTPDEILTPTSLGIAPLEIERGVVAPATAFAMIESARRASLGAGVSSHRDRLGALWAAFGEVAATNPHAWDRSRPTASEIASPSAENRMVAAPYTRRLCSQWNVDQAAALVFCRASTARRHGIDPERMVFPIAAALSDHIVPVAQRVRLDDSPGARVAGAAMFDAAGLGPGDVAYADLYSCFPSAVQLYADALGFPLTPAPTVTGGMTFAGGPLNNYVLQALVRLAEILRGDPGSVGLSSSVSGFLMKQGFSLWSTSAPARRYRSIDVTNTVAASTDGAAVRLVDPATRSSGVVVAITVVPQLDGTDTTVALVELDRDVRTIGVSTAIETAVSASSEEWIGRVVAVDADGTLLV